MIDVRPPAEYVSGHIAGARSIPIDKLARQLRRLPDGVEVVDAQPPMGPVNVPGPDGNSFVYIGAFNASNMPGWVANGIIDDFKLYDSALVP